MCVSMLSSAVTDSEVRAARLSEVRGESASRLILSSREFLLWDMTAHGKEGLLIRMS